MAQAYAILGKIDSAVYFGTKAFELGKHIQEKYRIIEAVKILSNIYKQKNSMDSALMYHEIYTLYKDSLFNRTKALEMAEIEQKYYAEKHRSNLKDQQKRRNFIITLGALFVVSVFAVFQWLFFSRLAEAEKTGKRKCGTVEPNRKRNYLVFKSGRNIRQNISTPQPTNGCQYIWYRD